jgi:hypothetical protein
MTAAKRIGYWDAENLEWRESDREYIETYETLTYPEEVGDYYRHQEIRHVTTYLDVETGLVVHDIVAYEKWISR